MTALGTSGTGVTTRTPITIDALDHLVLTVRDRAATIDFYVNVLGMRAEQAPNGRHSLHFGSQKINLHTLDDAITPRAEHAEPGSADICLLTRMPVEGVLRVLGDHGIDAEQGPIERAGAAGDLLSVYVRDPDGNLIEIANQLDPRN